ncbi:hypothetical protein QZH41_008636 [Actinostola sp. cb2023]|nr:hypothetical protein QZH41_008636 [Actinostola sp. cb2023]
MKLRRGVVFSVLTYNPRNLRDFYIIFHVFFSAVTCPRLSTPRSAKRFPTKDVLGLGSVVRFVCNDGFRLVGSGMRTCMADGQWSGVAPSCVGVSCIPTKAPLNGFVQQPHLRYGSTATYTCKSGFRIVYTAQRVCGKDGRWTNKQPLCIPALCPEPSVPANGMLVGLQRNQGDTVRFECKTGFKIDGSSYSVCQSNGQWSHPAPACKSKLLLP